MCFLRIRPDIAPIKPPGSAPTITTIYDEDKYIAAPTSPIPSSISTLQANSESRSTSPPARSYLPIAQKKQLRQRHKRSSLEGMPGNKASGTHDGLSEQKTVPRQKQRGKITDSSDMVAPLPAKAPQLPSELRDGDDRGDTIKKEALVTIGRVPKQEKKTMKEGSMEEEYRLNSSGLGNPGVGIGLAL